MSRAQGKVVFLAPTKPLVHQQYAACQAFMGSSKARAHPTYSLKETLLVPEAAPAAVMACVLISGLLKRLLSNPLQN